MRSLLATAGALAVVGGCAASSARRTAAPLGPVRAAPNPSVVVVVAAGGAPREFSTGFAVGPGLLVTTGHGVEGRSRVSVRFADGKRVSTLGVLAESPGHDLAVLDAGQDVVAPALRLSDRSPRAGDALSVAWASGVRSQRTDRAVVARAESRHPRWGSVFEIRAPLALGCSGAPVLDDDDRVVGVVIAGNPDQGYFFAVPARSVRALVAGLARRPGAEASLPGPAPDASRPR